MDFCPKKSNNKEVISIRLDSNVLSELDKMAYKIDISRNELIVQCIDYALQNLSK